MAEHFCPYGLNSKDLLERKEYEIEDHHPPSREETDAFKKEHGVEMTPQIFFDGEKIGGFDALRQYVGHQVRGADDYRDLRGRASNGPRVQLGVLWVDPSNPGLRVVHCDSDVLSCGSEIEGRRRVLNDVPEL